MKSPTTVTIDSRLKTLAKQKGINISEITEVALRTRLKGGNIDTASYALAIVEKQLDITQKRIVEKTEDLDNLKLILKKLVVEKEDLIKETERAESSKRTASIMRSMNDVIVSTSYDSETSWDLCGPFVGDLCKAGMDIDKEWFVKHVSRLKSIMGD